MINNLQEMLLHDTSKFLCILHKMPIDKSSRRIKEVSEQFIIFRSFEGKKLHEDKYLKIILTTEPIFTVCSVYKFKGLQRHRVE